MFELYALIAIILIFLVYLTYFILSTPQQKKHTTTRYCLKSQQKS